MDPDEALEQARAEAVEIEALFDQDSGDDDQIVETANALAGHFRAIDQWMSGGGFMPGAWKQHSGPLGRPRRLHDGLVLDGVTHGTRGSYNQGCRCMECTAANRAGGAAYRAKKKESS